MTSRPFDAMSRIDEYVDGLLSPDEVAAFERELKVSAELRSHLERQAHADREIRAMYRFDADGRSERSAARPTGAPPQGMAVGTLTLAGTENAATTGNQRGPSRTSTLIRLRRLAVAAVLVLGLAGAWAAYVHITTPGARLVSPQEIYLALENANWTPEEVCTEGPAFAQYVQSRMGQPLSITARPGLELVGWSYGDGYDGRIVGEKTVVMLARVNGRGVALLIDRAREDRSLSVPEASGLRIFRRVIGSLVVYEVTPWEKPLVLEALGG